MGLDAEWILEYEFRSIEIDGVGLWLILIRASLVNVASIVNDVVVMERIRAIVWSCLIDLRI